MSLAVGLLVWLGLAVALAGLIGPLIAIGMRGSGDGLPWDGLERRKGGR